MSLIYTVVESTLLVFGCLFMLLAAIGIVRMPDLFTRMQVTSKASVLGSICILMAVTVHFSESAVTIRAMVIIAFVVLTVPVATHMLARAGYATNIALSKETVINELEGSYDPETHTLAGQDPVTREFLIPDNSAVVGKRVMDLGLPSDVLILLIRRRGGVVVPRGQTQIEGADTLLVLAEPKLLNIARTTLEAPATFPAEASDIQTASAQTRES